MLHLDAAEAAMLRLGADPVPPASGAAANVGFWLAGGGVATLRVHVAGALHALVVSGTGSLRITRMG